MMNSLGFAFAAVALNLHHAAVPIYPASALSRLTSRYGRERWSSAAGLAQNMGADIWQTQLFGDCRRWRSLSPGSNLSLP